jgi:hypothetical protein
MRDVGQLRIEFSRLRELNIGLGTRIERLRDGVAFDRQLATRVPDGQSEA